MRQSRLPFLRHAIFVDWHGVLSSDPFWLSIMESNNHPLRPCLEAKLAEIFSGNLTTLHSWMKGILSSKEVISKLGIQLDRRFRQDFLNRRLEDDCRRLKVNIDLLDVLRVAKTSAFVVIATDNMDCFVRAFDYARNRVHRSTNTREEIFIDWADVWDDIICSSEVGQLKSEDPVGFFGRWLSVYNLQFSDALLIDDRADNCEAFKKQGGSVIQWKMGKGEIHHVRELVEQWLGTLSCPDSCEK